MNFSELAQDAYPWLKAFHVVAVTAWMAGLFYLPRLFVYHAGSSIGSEKSETFKVMEQRLLSIIMAPAMIATWILGVALVVINEWWNEPWLIAKVGLVVVLTLFHFWLGACARGFLHDRNRLSGRTYRIANELPTLLLIAIVILVIVRPF